MVLIVVVPEEVITVKNLILLTKTVVKAKNEVFDKEKGLAMAISKKFAGNNGNNGKINSFFFSFLLFCQKIMNQ